MKVDTEIRYVTKGDTVFEDLVFTPEESAMAMLKSDLHMAITRIIRERKLSPRDLEKILDIQQPRVSELLSGKLYKLSADKLVTYLHRLGGKVTITTEVSTESKPDEATA